ncbi:MAG: AhpC/TSA family protein [Burkholderiales bacterium]|nr:MAG: AhpC/TSA family protein [Burkholderiales bacterium]
MTLNDLLDTYWRHAAERSPALAAAVEREARALLASGRLERAMRVGDTAPDIVLPDASDGRVRLSDLLRTGPVVLAFYRGRWCTFCTLELRAWQRVLPDLRALGAHLIAVSPQDEHEISLMRERDRLELHMVSDADNGIARRFGIAHEIAPELREAYAQAGMVRPACGTASDWSLPLPAVYLIGTDGRVAEAWVDADWRHRAEPAEVVERVAALQRR